MASMFSYWTSLLAGLYNTNALWIPQLDFRATNAIHKKRLQDPLFKADFLMHFAENQFEKENRGSSR